MGREYRHRQRVKRFNQIVPLLTLGVLVAVVSQLNVFQTARFALGSLIGLVLAGSVSYYTWREGEGDLLWDYLLGSISVYLAGLGVGGLHVFDFIVTSMETFVVVAGLGGLTLFLYFADQYFKDRIGIAFATILGLGIGVFVL
ncbi:hypothetical protein ACFQER_03080 [Halomicroarcula sp. GCM10025894]|uniref:hypothetical protein n=1 Tax=Halomicroarcula sp. GCM10025894 TaxID=3252673 RepID=UPI003612A86D